MVQRVPTPTTVATVAIVSAIYKTVAGALGDDLTKMQANLVENGNKPLTDWISRRLKEMGARQVTYAAMLHSVTIFDFAGLCWADYVSTCTDQALQLAFPRTPKVKKLLDAPWFAQSIVASLGTAQSIVGLAPEIKSCTLSEEETLDILTSHLVDHVLETCGDESPDDHMKQFIGSGCKYVFKNLPALLESAPGVGDKLRHSWIRESARAAVSVRDALAPDAESLDRAISKYRATLKMKLESEDVFGREFGNDDLARMPLGAVYVEPDCRRSDTKFVGPVKKQVVSALDAAIRFMVISAPFGSGKTLTCRELAAHLSVREGVIPLYIKCPDVMRSEPLEDALARSIARDLVVRYEVARELLNTHKWIVILDGFDELAAPQENMRAAFREARGLANRHNISIVLTSRPTGFEKSWLSGSLLIEIQNFGDPHIVQWLEKASSYIPLARGLSLQDLKARVPYEIIGTPILLLLTVYSGAAHNTRSLSTTEIYELFFRKISRGKLVDIQEPHGKIDQTITRIGEEQYELTLAVVAWKTLGRSTFARSELSAILNQFAGRDVPPSVLDDLFASIALAMLKSPSADHRDEYTFTHKSFQEFLAARHLFAIVDSPPPEPGHRTPLWRALCQMNPHQNREVFKHFIDMLRREPEKAVLAGDACENFFVELVSTGIGIFIEPGSTSFRRAISDSDWAVFPNLGSDVGANLIASSILIMSRVRGFADGVQSALEGCRYFGKSHGKHFVFSILDYVGYLEFAQSVNVETGGFHIIASDITNSGKGRQGLFSTLAPSLLEYSVLSDRAAVSERLDTVAIIEADELGAVIVMCRNLIAAGFAVPASLHLIVRASGQWKLVAPPSLSGETEDEHGALAAVVCSYMFFYIRNLEGFDFSEMSIFSGIMDGIAAVHQMVWSGEDESLIVDRVKEVFGLWYKYGVDGI